MFSKFYSMHHLGETKMKPITFKPLFHVFIDFAMTLSITTNINTSNDILFSLH